MNDNIKLQRKYFSLLRMETKIYSNEYILKCESKHIEKEVANNSLYLLIKRILILLYMGKKLSRKSS
jgi:hypothetical protein